MVLPINEHATATHLQFARDGVWEEALELDLHEHKKSKKLRAWLEETTTPDIAVEIFFKQNHPDREHFHGIGKQFFGMRLSSMPREEQLILCPALLEYFNSHGRHTWRAFRDNFDLLKQFNFLQGMPSFIEMGAIGAWQSHGPVKFWQPDTKISVQDAFSRARVNNGHYNLVEKPVAIEVAFEEPIPHWSGTIISARGKDTQKHHIKKRMPEDVCGAIDEHIRSLAPIPPVAEFKPPGSRPIPTG